MSGADWKAGDLAVCIVDRWCPCGRPQCGVNAISPQKEELLCVAGVSMCDGQFFLSFKGKQQGMFWHAIAFRKVKPDTEPAVDEEWVQQLQHLRRKVPA